MKSPPPVRVNCPSSSILGWPLNRLKRGGENLVHGAEWEGLIVFFHIPFSKVEVKFEFSPALPMENVVVRR